METRTRKLAPQYHRQDWRSKQSGNTAACKYTREFILKNYQNLKEPHFNCKEEDQEIILHSPSPPLLTAVFPFAHQLGEDPNSRKYPLREKKAEQMPEWYEDEEPKETIPQTFPVPEVQEKTHSKQQAPTEVKLVLVSPNIKNFSQGKDLEDKDYEEKFTKIDLQVEEKLKSLVTEDDYAIPEWDEPAKEEFTFEPIKVPKPVAPIYESNLLRYHFAIGNPFAQTLIDFGIPYGKNAITFNLGSKPFEKIWYYKDLEAHVHGPFSTLEMFGWTIRNCFPPDLEIAIGNSLYFVPMNIFNSAPQIPEPEYYNKKNKPKTLEEIESKQNLKTEKYSNSRTDHKKSSRSNETATLELKNILGINKKK
jgi:GYF domain